MPVSVLAHPLVPGVDAFFTGRDLDAEAPAIGEAGNLSQRRPHDPRRLGADRAAACAQMSLHPDDLVWMHQVHGNDVATVDAATAPAAELRGVDALVTDVVGRGLAVQTADCVPVLLASSSGVLAAVHAGRNGVLVGVVEATLDRMVELGADAATITAVLGPSIGPCCYEVSDDLAGAAEALVDGITATTTWGTTSLDLPAAVLRQLTARGASGVQPFGCTRCDADGRWFSHRATPSAGRQVSVVVAR